MDSRLKTLLFFVQQVLRNVCIPCAEKVTIFWFGQCVFDMVFVTDGREVLVAETFIEK